MFVSLSRHAVRSSFSCSHSTCHGDKMINRRASARGQGSQFRPQLLQLCVCCESDVCPRTPGFLSITFFPNLILAAAIKKDSPKVTKRQATFAQSRTAEGNAFPHPRGNEVFLPPLSGFIITTGVGKKSARQ